MNDCMGAMPELNFVSTMTSNSWATAITSNSRCDMEEQGGFAIMVIPFPTMTGFKDGAMVAAHGSNLLRFDFSWNKAGQFSHITLYSSHVLLYVNVTLSTQLFLVFNLFRDGFKNFDQPIPVHSSKPTWEKVIRSLTSQTEAVLRPWTYGELNNQSANNLPNQLAIPLEHKYSKRNLSFDGLEDEDRIIAEFLRNCKDSTEELTGYKEPGYPNYGYSETESEESKESEEDDDDEDDEDVDDDEGEGGEDDEEDEVLGDIVYFFLFLWFLMLYVLESVRCQANCN